MFNMFSRNSLGEYDYNSLEDFIAGNLRELDYRNADTNNPRDAAGRFNMDYTNNITSNIYRYIGTEFNIYYDVTNPINIFIDGNDPIQVANDVIAKRNITCFGFSDGEIKPAITGGDGTGNFIYSWNGPNGFTSSEKDSLYNVMKNLLELDFHTIKFLFTYVEPLLFTNFVSNHIKIKKYITNKLNNLELYFDRYKEWLKKIDASVPTSSSSTTIKNEFDTFYKDAIYLIL